MVKRPSCEATSASAVAATAGPGLIGGERHESRPAEQIGVRVSQWLRPLLPARYRVVPAERIAHHLLAAALAAAPGVRVLMSEELV